MRVPANPPARFSPLWKGDHKLINDNDTSISQQDERAAHILYQLRAVSVF